MNGHAFRRELTPVDFLERAGLVHAERPAVRDGAVTYTFAQWRERARRFASALRQAGVGPGDRVAFLALNTEPLLLAHFAVPLAGGVLVAINTRLTAGEVGYILEHSQARLLFRSPELAASCPEDIGAGLIELGPEFEALLQSGSPEALDARLQTEDDPIAIDYTSGTTGRPKGAVYHHRGAYLNALGMVIENRLDTRTRFLWTLPMFHCNGWCHTWALVAAGAQSVCLPRLEPARVWQLLDEDRITHFNAAPTVLIMLAADPAAHRLAQRVRVCTGGAAPSPSLIARMESFNMELVHLYGLTESYGPVTINPLQEQDATEPEHTARLLARQGMSHVTAAQARVVDEDMQDVPADGVTMGEVVLRGNTVMREYHRAPEETEAAFRGGWYHTGDLAVVHRDGAIELRDRSKDIIISGGENISSIEVEQAIATHPAVLECAVIPVADALWGEVPTAVVTLHAGQQATAQEIIDHCRERLAHFKCPRHVEFGELPKTSTGKVQKYLLRQRATEASTPAP